MKIAKLSYTSKQKILEKGRYSALLANAPRYNMRHLVLCAAENNLATSRLGLIVAKRKLSSAVARNRLRRVIRESFRKQQHNLPKMDIIVIAKTSIVDADFCQLGKTLDLSWAKAAAICLRNARKDVQ